MLLRGHRPHKANEGAIHESYWRHIGPRVYWPDPIHCRVLLSLFCSYITGKRSAKDRASEFVQQIHVRASKNVRQPLDIGTDVCRIIRRTHLVNEEGGTAWSFQPIYIPIVFRDTSCATWSFVCFHGTLLDEFRVKRQSCPATTTTLHCIGDLRGHIPADLCMLHVQVVQAQHLLLIRPETRALDRCRLVAVRV